MKANQCGLDKAQTLNVHVIISRTISSSFLAQRRLFLKQRDDRSSPSSLCGTPDGLTAVSLVERGLQRLHWVDRYGERKSDTCYLFQLQNAVPPHRLGFRESSFLQLQVSALKGLIPLQAPLGNRDTLTSCLSSWKI